MTPGLTHDQEARQLCDQIRAIHTLGPAGTNCQRAAEVWFERQGRRGQVLLHPTLEQAVEELHGQPGAALLGCVVYPRLHEIVFHNLHRLRLVDCFIVPTHNMVLAARPGVETIRSISTHPAPAGLVPPTVSQQRLVTSNTQAAIDCASGLSDACITTITGCRQQGLRLVQDFGPVQMGFTIHAQIGPAAR